MKKLFFLLCLVMIVLSACSYPVPAAPSGIPLEQQAGTIVAQTLTAVALNNSLMVNTPLASPTSGETQPLASATSGGPASTIQPPATPTNGTGTATATTLTVDSNTNCREGPGTTYIVVIVLVPGTTYQMIARTADNKYWVVTEIGKATACWVPAEMSNAFGNVNLLPVTTPSAPTASAAGSVSAPTGLRYTYFCTFNGSNSDITVSLTWADRSTNETGYRVYRNNTLVASLPANSTSYTDIFAGSQTAYYSYRISAYNSLGEALGNSISLSCSG
jgi:hypothetical protein